MNKLYISTASDGINYILKNSDNKPIVSGNINHSQIEIAKRQGIHNLSMIVLQFDYRIYGEFETVLRD